MPSRCAGAPTTSAAPPIRSAVASATGRTVTCAHGSAMRTPSAIAPATAPVLPNMVSHTTATSVALTSEPSGHPPRRHGQVPAAPEHGPLALLTSPVVGGLVALRGPVLVDKP